MATMGGLDIPTIPESLSSIDLPEAARNYELKDIHFNMMPSFHGMSTEDPLAHIRDIFNMVSNMALRGVAEEHLRMKLFPYTMKDKAKTWLNSLRPGTLKCWNDIQNKFLEKFFSTQKTDTLRDNIMQFTQHADETFSKAWERFNNLLNQCPHHGLPPLVLMWIFYKGLTVSSKAAVNNYAGGSIKRKTLVECQALFDTLALETQHFEARGGRHAGVFEINNSTDFASKAQVDAIASKLDTLLSMNGRAPVQEVCSICAVPGHATVGCPYGVEFPKFVQEQANMVNAYKRPSNDPYSNTYNQGWRNHPNLSWVNNQSVQKLPSGFLPQEKNNNLEDIIAQLAGNVNSLSVTTHQFMSKTDTTLQNQAASIKNLEVQMGQLAHALTATEKGSSLSQIEVNPRNQEQAMAITIRRGKQIFIL